MNQDNQVIKTLLVVEDDPGIQRQLKWSFEGYHVIIAGDREAAIAEMRRHEPGVALLDLGLPPDPENASEGLAALQELLRLVPETKIIVVTGNDDHANAVKAIGLGAYDFYQKPIDPEVLGLIIARAFHVHALEQENRLLARQYNQSPLCGITASSPQMLKICRTIEKVAPSDVTTLLLGESGTGKEVLARAIHALSTRAGGRFVPINCAAIPETLLESELFGYEKGAFTGANKQTIGKIEGANGGTLFLDEIGDLPMSLQAKLLRFLQERVIERVGGRQEIPVDVRVVCATHQDLPAYIKDGRFREDLYYRISEMTITIPPLRERTGDAILLAKVLLERYAGARAKAPRNFSQEALAAIEAHRWDGNVRELENRIKRAVIMAEGALITAEDLELTADGHASLPLNLKQVREDAEQIAIRRVMSMCGGKVSQAAEMLGVTRPTLYSLMEKYGLKP